jgi:hypothetical protein
MCICLNFEKAIAPCQCRFNSRPSTNPTSRPPMATLARLPCQLARLRDASRAGGRAPGLPGRGTGRANLHRDRARVSPPRPPRSRPVRPIASLASPCQRPVGRSNRASLACWGLNLGNGRFNPPTCEGERPPESFIMAARRKSLPRPPPVRGWVPLCYPPPSHALSAGVPRPKTVFLKK